MRGFTATIEYGLNAETKEEAEKEVKEFIKKMNSYCPIALIKIE